MNIANDIFSKRLRQARIKARLSMDELCQRLNGLVTKQAISKYEAAKMLPSSTITIALAEALGVEQDYFYRQFAFDIDAFRVSFRKKYNVGKKDVEALKVQIQDEVERYLEIEEILDEKRELLSCVPPTCIKNVSDAEQYARQLRKDWQLGKGCIANVLELLEAHGVKVVATDAPDGFDGLSGILNEKHYIIVLNSSKSHIERRRLTAMHELGHLLQNSHFAPDLSQHDKEKLCNAFASEMLLPSDVLSEAFDGKRNISATELVNIGTKFGISADAVIMKLHEMGLVSDKRYRGYCVYKNKDNGFKNYVEQTHFIESFSNNFENMVCSALAQRLITESKAASLLCTSISKIRNNTKVI